MKVNNFPFLEEIEEKTAESLNGGFGGGLGNDTLIGGENDDVPGKGPDEPVVRLTRNDPAGTSPGRVSRVYIIFP